MYARGVSAAPRDAAILGNYAVFLQKVRNEADRAEEFYRRALEADPAHADNLGNYAQLLFGRGDDEEAVRLCDQALAAPLAGPPLRLEIAFYLLVHVPSRASDAFDDVRTLVAEGVRSEGWDFTANLDRARKEGDPRLPFLSALAEVISGKAEAGTLEQFPEWTGAADR